MTASHADLVDAAVAWLRRGVHVAPDGMSPRRCSIAVGEHHCASTERPDAFGLSWGFSIVVECKVSRADFLADRRKPHASDPHSGMGRYRYYLTPPGLVHADEVPAWCGYATLHSRSVKVEKLAPFRERHSATDDCLMLASIARLHELGVPFDRRRRGRFRTAADAMGRKAYAAPTKETR